MRFTNYTLLPNCLVRNVEDRHGNCVAELRSTRGQHPKSWFVSPTDLRCDVREFSIKSDAVDYCAHLAR